MNLRIHLVITTYPLGKPPHLPDYIKNNRYIIGLEKDKNNANLYKDHFCFFRCLTIGKFGKTRHNCNQKAKELFQDYCQHFRVKPQDFEGVELDEFPELEKYYEVQFSHQGRILWNQLPQNIKDEKSLKVFKRKLKARLLSTY